MSVEAPRMAGGEFGRLACQYAARGARGTFYNTTDKKSCVSCLKRRMLSVNKRII